MRRLLLALLVAVGGCHTCEAPPFAEPTGGEVTIFVHGIKGSFLYTEEGERAWLSASDLLSSGDRSLALPPGGKDRFGPLRVGGPLTRFTIFPLIATADVYLPWLEFGQEKLPGFLPFSYDWRRDARLAVEGLAKRIDELAAKRGGALRVNLVGHSLGGLIAMTYVRYGSGDPAKGVTWAGAKFVKRLVLAGAPFGGAPGFLKDILEGDKTGRNEKLLSREAMASFVSAYELLPYPGTFFTDDQKTVDDPETWKKLGAAVPSDIVSILSRRWSFRQALRDDEKAPSPPSELKVLVVAGTDRPTIEKVAIADELGWWAASFSGSPTTSGDSRVPEKACTPPSPLTFEKVTTDADHVNLLNDEKVQDAIRVFLSR
jgi:pimeloyl-ACP methyl ester carboxylesterase